MHHSLGFNPELFSLTTLGEERGFIGLNVTKRLLTPQHEKGRNQHTSKANLVTRG